MKFLYCALTERKEGDTMLKTTEEILMQDPWGRLRLATIEMEKAISVAPLLKKVNDETSVLPYLSEFHRALSGCGLVRPFNWNEWGAPALTAENAAFLSDDEDWRHVTRIIRGDRFHEGVFRAHALDGSLVALVKRSYYVRQTTSGWPTALSEMDDMDLEIGLRVEGRRAGQVGTTTGFRSQIRVGNLKDWEFQVLWNDGTTSIEQMRHWHVVAPLKTLTQISRPGR